MKDQDKKIKAAIDGLEEVSGAAFDKAKAWDKLQQRMEVQPAMPKRKIYYSIAAAVLLAFIGIPFLLPHGNEQSISQVKPKTIVKLQEVKPEELTAETTPTEPAIPAYTSTHKKYPIQSRIETINSDQPETNIEPIEAPKPIEAVQNVATIATPVMKVVHINDIADQPLPLEKPEAPAFFTIVRPKPRPPIQQHETIAQGEPSNHIKFRF